MTDGGGKLRNAVELMCLTMGMAISATVQSKREGFVVGQNMKWSTFKEVTEVLDSKEDSQ